MPPRVSNAVPSMIRRARLLMASGRDGRAEIAADVEVLDQQPLLAARGALDVAHLRHAHLAAGRAADGGREPALHVLGEAVAGDESQHQLAGTLLLVLHAVDGAELRE